MSTFIVKRSLLLISLSAALSASANDRPPILFVPGSDLLPKCMIAVRFNEDERSVKESEYVDGSYCLGLVRGVLGVNEHLAPISPLFCLPPPGLKTWQVAKSIVKAAELKPELLQLPETEFVVRALKLTYPCRLPGQETTG